jgi:hypothetical protein
VDAEARLQHARQRLARAVQHRQPHQRRAAAQRRHRRQPTPLGRCGVGHGPGLGVELQRLEKRRRVGAWRGGHLAQPGGTQPGKEQQRRQQATYCCKSQQVDRRLSQQEVVPQQLDGAIRPAAGAQEHGPSDVQ